MFWFVSHYFSLELFIIMKIVKDSHDLTQGHRTLPMNASCFCHIPTLWLAAGPALSFAVTELLSRTLIMIQRLSWGLIYFFIYLFLGESTRCGFLNWILQEERAQYLAKKPVFFFLPQTWYLMLRHPWEPCRGSPPLCFKLTCCGLKFNCLWKAYSSKVDSQWVLLTFLWRFDDLDRFLYFYLKISRLTFKTDLPWILRVVYFGGFKYS